MEKIIQVLRQSKLFQGISREEVKQCVHTTKGRINNLQKGESFLHEDDKVDAVTIVITGKLSVSKLYKDGSQSLLQLLKPTYMFGALVATSRLQESPWEVYAMEESKIYSLPMEYIMEKGRIKDNLRSQLLRNIVEFMANENIRKDYKIEILSCREVKQRVMRYLTIQQKKLEKNEFDITYNRAQLADYLCINRSVLSHELSQLREEGFIDFRKNHFHIMKSEQL